jgi:hypothetical protein
MKASGESQNTSSLAEAMPNLSGVSQPFPAGSPNKMGRRRFAEPRPLPDSIAQQRQLRADTTPLPSARAKPRALPTAPSIYSHRTLCRPCFLLAPSMTQMSVESASSAQKSTPTRQWGPTECHSGNTARDPNSPRPRGSRPRQACGCAYPGECGSGHEHVCLHLHSSLLHRNRRPQTIAGRRCREGRSTSNRCN